MEPRKQEKKTSRFHIEKLEERIAPIVHRFSPVPIFANGAVQASNFAAGGTAAAVFNGGPIGSAGHPVGFPVPTSTPGVGPSL